MHYTVKAAAVLLIDIVRFYRQNMKKVKQHWNIWIKFFLSDLCKARRSVNEPTKYKINL